jgi:hypothetical protein
MVRVTSIRPPLAFAMLILAFCEPAIAAERCLSSVCLGAKLRDLKVPWESRATQIKDNTALYAMVDESGERRRARARSAFPGVTDREIALIAQYANPEGGWLVDAQAFEVFAAISKACSFDPLAGSFRSESGHMTWVTLRPMILDSEESTFVVALIERLYRGVDPDSAEGEALLEQLRSKVGSVCALKDAMVGECEGAVFDDDPAGMVVELRDQSLDAPRNYAGHRENSEEYRRLRDQAGCKIDVHVD